MLPLYSGSSAPFQSSSAIRSLGSYISNTPIPNSQLGNIFGQLTLSSILKNKRDTKLIVIQNLSSLPQTFSIYTELPEDSLYVVKIAFSLPATDQCDNKYFEQISSPDQLPYTSVLTLHEGLENAITTGTIQPNAYFGIWLCREIRSEVVQQYTTMSTDGTIGGCTDQSIQILEQRLLNNRTVECNLKISW